MPSLSSLLNKLKGKDISEKALANQLALEQLSIEEQHAKRQQYIAKYIIPVLLLAVYIILPITSIIIAGVHMNHDEEDYQYYVAAVYQELVQQQENQRENSSLLGSIVSIFTNKPGDVLNMKENAATFAKSQMCSRPLHLWLLIAGIAFLLNVPMIYLYQMNFKLKKRQKNGLFDKLKNQLTTKTKSLVACLIGCMALVIQPFNFAWSIIGIIWAYNTSYNQYCNLLLFLSTLVITTVIFFSVFGHAYLIMQIINQLKKHKSKTGDSLKDYSPYFITESDKKK